MEIYMAKRTPVVCQHLENISRSALEKYQDIVRQYIRGRHGIYALYRKDKLYYVGLATNLRGRLKQHLKDRHGKSWDRFSVYLTIGDSQIKELESLLLRIVKPTGNRQGGRFFRSDNLRTRLARDIRLLQRDELNSLVGRIRRVVKVRDDEVRISGRRPTLASFVTGGLKLRARFKRKLVRAIVRKDGVVRFNGKIYNSPSMAAAAACGRRTCNGWSFWQYERAPGDWVSLRELKR